MSQHKTMSAGLLISAIGVVYGDIGTSPLYALKETFAGHHPIPVTPENIFGVLSLVFWTVMLLVTVKYVIIIMRADNHGEGGSLALLALVTELTKGYRVHYPLMLLGVIAAALFYGDSMITPAISVLCGGRRPRSRHAGLQALCGADHRRGADRAVLRSRSAAPAWSGMLFGPVMMAWFVVLAMLGIVNIVSPRRTCSPRSIRSTRRNSSSATR